MRYLQEHESWSVYLPELRRGERPAAWLGRWDGDGFQVSDVFRQRGLSRQVLESRYLAVLRRTPHEEIMRV